MYATAAQINSVPIVSAPLGFDFDVDGRAVLAALTPNTKLIFICSPNDPTGNCADRQTVLSILDSFDGLVIIDEAYIDFCQRRTFLPLLSEYPNLVVLQTLSKAWGLAGLRIGLALGSPELIQVLSKIKYPYNISSTSQEQALSALQHEEQKDALVADILRERHQLRVELQLLECVVDVYPSEANFLLVRMTDARHTYQHLIQNGIVVRDRSDEPQCGNCLRITVGTRMENQELIDVLRQI
jgi:histidinol-phosphate aminotransferase